MIMEYQKIMNLLVNTPNQPSKFVDSRERYNPNSQGKFKISILKSILCDYKDAYILVKENIAIIGDAGTPAGRADK